MMAISQPIGRGQLLAADFKRRIVSTLEFSHPVTVYVKPNRVEMFAELDSQRQADITETDYGDLGFFQIPHN
jgi:hypothetical protein